MHKHLWKVLFVMLLLTTTVSMAADNTTSSWRRGNAEVQEHINDLDSDPVEHIAVPVLLGVSLKNITPNFGEARAGHAHEGLDIMAREGTPIVAPTTAVVVQTGFYEGAGNFVSTAVPGDESFIYMHLSKIADITPGDVLEAGELIGYVGHTGNAIASAPHLHFEIRDINGVASDPYPRITSVFSTADKMKYLDDIFGDISDDDVLADLLVANFKSEFTTAQTGNITLPSAITTALKKVGSSVTSTTATSASFTLLRVGSRGSDVATLQKFLIAQRVGTASRVVADGAFGPITRQALIDYQRSVGLVADGVYGPKSHAYVTAHA